MKGNSIKIGNDKYQDYPEAEMDQVVTIGFRCHTPAQVELAFSFMKQHNKLKKKECPWIIKYLPKI